MKLSRGSYWLFLWLKNVQVQVSFLKQRRQSLSADFHNDCWHLRECLWKEHQQGMMHYT